MPAKPDGKKRREDAAAAAQKRLSGPEKEAQVLERIGRFVDPLCAAEGLERVYMEYLREPAGRVLPLYIDKPGGVTIDDCARISRQVGDYLDVAADCRWLERVVGGQDPDRSVVPGARTRAGGRVEPYRRSSHCLVAARAVGGQTGPLRRPGLRRARTLR